MAFLDDRKVTEERLKACVKNSNTVHGKLKLKELNDRNQVITSKYRSKVDVMTGITVETNKPTCVKIRYR